MEYRDPFARSSQAQAQAQVQEYGQTRAVERDAGLRAYMLGIYNYMASALALTGIVALWAANTPAFMSLIYTVQDGRMAGITGLGYVIMFAPIGLVLWLGMGIQSMSLRTAQGIYWVYATLIGLSMSSIFLVYTGESIARTFFITAGTFGAMSLYGYTTKRDLTRFGSFLIMGLIGIILASLVNIFLKSSALGFATSVIGLFIFIGLTAWDTQKLKGMYYHLAGDTQALAKASVMGALNLYMDFINIFMHLLRFMGERRG
jgi:uncharacterized protein